MIVYLNLDGTGRGGPHVWSLRMQRALAQRGFQVAHDLKSAWEAALFVADTDGMETALERGRPVGYRVAGGYDIAWFRAMQRQMTEKYHAANAVIARALERAGMVFYQSQWAKRHLDNLLFSRQQDFSIIYNGVDLDQFSPHGRTQSDIPVLGTAGILRYRFRLETFFKLSIRIGIPHRLLIIGSLDDENKQVLEEYTRYPSVGSRTTYHPYLHPDALPAYFRQMSLLIHPVCGDACPNVVIEALACGTPVVAPRFGGSAELAGEAGVVFDCIPWVYDEDFVDALVQSTKQALSNAEHRSILARQRTEREFDLSRMVDRYLLALGLPLTVETRKTDPKHLIRSKRPNLLRSTASRLITRPRYLTAMALRKAGGLRQKSSSRKKNIKPRIAFTLYDFQIGGIENWLYRLARHLCGEFDFYFLATKVPDFLAKFHQVGVCAYLPTPRQMLAYLRKHAIDLVQVHNERWPIDAALAAGIAHVIERTDGPRSCARVPKHGVELVIASTQGTVPMIAERYPLENIRMIYNGIDLEEVDKASTERLWPTDLFIMGQVSRFGRGKNLGMLFQVMNRLPHLGDRLRLVLIGGDSRMPGAEKIESELRLQAMPLGDKVAFMGEKEDSLPWIKGFDVGTCASDNEGIPNSLIEAMACEKPVISTDVGQVRELVQDGRSGFLVPPGGVEAFCLAVETLVNNPALCVQMGKVGRQIVEERFSIRRAAAQYSEIYHQLLGR